MVRLVTSFLKHPVRVIVIFAVAAVICGICSFGVSTNFDFADYLPDTAKSTIGLDVYKDEFGGDLPNARVLYTDVTLRQALMMKSDIEKIPGVLDVEWLDDVADLNIPLNVQNQTTVENYFRNGNALYTVTVDDDTKQETVAALRKLIGNKGALSGSVVEVANAMSSSAGEVPKIAMFVVPLVLIILLVTTSSWLEPFLFLLAIGAAIVLNMGTNLIFGQISFVTATCASILQFAVSMDYSIFLLHRFAEYKSEGLETRPAMFLAVKHAFSTVSASAMTTIIGFWVLVFMKFKIGPDMGWVLAKGIALSLFSIMILLPALVLVSEKWIDKTKHRPIVRDVNKLAKTMIRFEIVVLLLVALLAVPAYLAQGKANFTFGASEFFNAQTQIGKDRALIEKDFGKSNEMVILIPKEMRGKELSFSKKLESMKYVTSVISYSNSIGNEIPPELLTAAQYDAFFSKHYSRVVVISDLSTESPEVFHLIDGIRSTAKSYFGANYHLIGESVSTYDMKVIISKDNKTVTALAIIGIGLVILITFRNFLLPILLVLIIECAIWINLSVPYFTDIKLVYIAYLILSSIQLGSTVDYAILYSDRYVNFRQTMGKKDAIVKTNQVSITTIITSASILAIAGFCMGFISSNYAISQIGILIGRGTLLSAVAVMFALPALLRIFDYPIKKLSFSPKKNRKEEAE